ncbi:MAG: hypothetical protein NZ899_08015 [Thermoguttaceae bacterium]|nr:hypothetical protein [Thermoguttaceae bacterium]MDW8078110.1 hypothetical protein [Thermoguttaceae bacterium]
MDAQPNTEINGIQPVAGGIEGSPQSEDTIRRPWEKKGEEEGGWTLSFSAVTASALLADVLVPGGVPIPPETIVTETRVRHQLSFIPRAVHRAAALFDDTPKAELTRPEKQAPTTVSAHGLARFDPPHTQKAPHRGELYLPAAGQPSTNNRNLTQLFGSACVASGLFVASLAGTLALVGGTDKPQWWVELAISAAGALIALLGHLIQKRACRVGHKGIRPTNGPGVTQESQDPPVTSGQANPC